MFPNTEEWATKMAQYLINTIEKDDLEKYKISTDIFSTIFLAGSPWAGKTEWIESFGHKEHYIVLDTDEYRKLFDGYKWDNAEEFQQYASRVMDKMFSFCMKNGLNVIVDGTFANKHIIRQNIYQCIKRERVFMVALVLQDPIISYLYTKKRELEKTRKVPVEAFLEKFFSSIENTRFVLEHYKDATVLVTKKDPTGTKRQRYKNIFMRNLEDFDKETQIWYNAKDDICELIRKIDRDIVRNNTPFFYWLFKKLCDLFR